MGTTELERLVLDRLGRSAEPSQDAPGVAAMAVRSVALVIAELDVLMGREAALAIYGRALHVSRRTCPSLPPMGDAAPLIAPWEALRAVLGRHTAQEAGEAGVVLLTNLGMVLATLLGEALAERLLRRAWAEPSPDHS